MKDRPARKSLTLSPAGSGPSFFIAAVFLLFLFFLLRAAFLLPPAWAQDPAALRFDDYVLDQAGLLRPEEKKELVSLLADFDQKTTNQFLVVILPSLPPATSLELYSLELAEAAKAGRAGKDNGLLLLILKDDRKIRIEVGTGLEEKITDGRAGRVIREILAPAFQQDEYYQGIKAAMHSLMGWVDPLTPRPGRGMILRKKMKRAFPSSPSCSWFYLSSFSPALTREGSDGDTLRPLSGRLSAVVRPEGPAVFAAAAAVSVAAGPAAGGRAGRPARTRRRATSRITVLHKTKRPRPPLPAKEGRGLFLNTARQFSGEKQGDGDRASYSPAGILINSFCGSTKKERGRI